MWRKDGRPVPTIDHKTFHRYQRRFWGYTRESYLTKRVLLYQRSADGKERPVAFIPFASFR